VALAAPHVASRLRKAVGLPERDGLLVRGVVDGSPAAAAGIQEGDLLVKAGDADLVTPDDLFAALATVQPGGSLAVALVRGADELTVTASFPAP
jgi:S1-C subfamily serine protease